MPNDVSFASSGDVCAAWHFPGRGDDFTNNHGRPCVVMAHGFSMTADSGLLDYAERISAAGVDVLVFDYRDFGANTRQAGQAEVRPTAQLADYRAAVARARGLPGVDPGRIVVWGVSLSSGHALSLAAHDHAVAGVIALTPAVNVGAAIRKGLRQTAPKVALQLLLSVLRDAAAAMQGNARVTIPMAGEPGSCAAATSDGALAGYARTAGPTAVNAVAAMSVVRCAVYRPDRKADKITCPVLIQIADDDSLAPPEPALKAAFRCRADVRHYPCDHFDVYPSGDWFDAAVEHQLHFLRRNFASQSPFAPVIPLTRHTGHG